MFIRSVTSLLSVMAVAGISACASTPPVEPTDPVIEERPERDVSSVRSDDRYTHPSSRRPREERVVMPRDRKIDLDVGSSVRIQLPKR